MREQVIALNAVATRTEVSEHAAVELMTSERFAPPQDTPLSVEPCEQDRRYVGHFRRSILPLLSVWGCGLLVLGASAAHGNVRQLFLDPSYANGAPWWTGLISQLGILGWTSAVASASWAAWIARHTGRTNAARFLFRGAIASTVLLVDDLLGVHSMFWTLGLMGKPFGLALVLSPVAAWFWVYRTDIRRTRWVLLAGAFLANALSVVADTLAHGSLSDRSALLEDGPKFLGILAWAAYFIASTYDIARSALLSATLRAPLPGGGLPSTPAPKASP